jgi:hypothetical protein
LTGDPRRFKLSANAPGAEFSMTLPLQVVHEDNVTIIYCPERVIAEETEELRTAAVKAIEQTGRVIFQLASCNNWTALAWVYSPLCVCRLASVQVM